MKTHNTIPPALCIAPRTVWNDKVVVRNAFVEYDLDKVKGGLVIYLSPSVGSAHRHQDLSWVARLCARARQGTRANAGSPAQATPGTLREGRRGLAGSAPSVVRRPVDHHRREQARED